MRLDASCVHAYLVAGGESRRLGRANARLDAGGEPFARRLANALAGAVDRVWLVCKPAQDYADLGLPILHDRTPEPATVHGIRTALEAPGPRWRFVLACDMPAVGPDLLRALFAAATAAGAPGAAAKLANAPGIEPLPSLWDAELAPAAATWPDLAARAWVARAGLATWNVPQEVEAWFAHVNTPAELAQWAASVQRPRGRD